MHAPWASRRPGKLTVQVSRCALKGRVKSRLRPSLFEPSVPKLTPKLWAVTNPTDCCGALEIVVGSGSTSELVDCIMKFPTCMARRLQNVQSSDTCIPETASDSMNQRRPMSLPIQEHGHGGAAVCDPNKR
eukprot:3457068-Amphidinium_carterae.2